MLKRIFSKQNRALLAELVRTDFKLRYHGSILGYMWSLLKPLLMFAILYVVFVRVFPLGKGIPHYPVYLFTGIVIWNFFTEMTQQSLGSIVGRGDLIRKVKIPRWVIVFSSSISAVISLMLNLVVLGVFMVVNHVPLTHTVALFPLPLLEVYLFGLGVSLILATAFVKYRDLTHIWEVVLQAGFYLTPILYPMSKITDVTAQKIMLLNPMAQSIQDARYSLVTHSQPTTWKVFDGGYYALIPLGVVLLALFAGQRYFRKESKYFAENI